MGMEGRESMAQDWLADVRKYVADADEKVVKAIVRYCGIALQKVDSSLVSFSDSKETDRVRQNFLKKKLGLTQSDAELDAAIASVGERMKADRTKNRVTVYYLLAEHFDALGIFGGVARGAGAGAGAAVAAAAAAGAAGLAAATPAAAAPAAAETAAPLAAMAAPEPAAPVASPAAPAAPAAPKRPATPAERSAALSPDDGIFGWGCGVAALVLGCIILAALLAWWIFYSRDTPEAVATPTPPPVAAPAATPAPAPPPVEIPTGSGIIAGERNGKPMLTVYFDTAKSDLPADFAKVAAVVTDYVAKNPTAKLAVSGFNDPRGNAAANAELSKNRAQSVGKGLEGLGVPATAIELVKPEAATDAQADMANARRVEVVVQ
jgi:outer membrane protein OmpA-like peptidoglycan-associated protein